MYTMKENVTFEKIGTYDVENIFLKDMLSAQVIGVQDIDYYRKQDVDFLVFCNGNRHKVELKVDSMGDVTGNIFCETISNTTKCTDGCFVYTECDFWLYYLVNTKTLYMFHMNMFREWVLGQEDGVWRKRRTSTAIGNGDSYQTEGLLVPISEILEKAPALVKVYDLNKKERVH